MSLKYFPYLFMESHSTDRAQLSNQITDHIFWLPLPHNQGTANAKYWPELSLILLLFMCTGGPSSGPGTHVLVLYRAPTACGGKQTGFD